MNSDHSFSLKCFQYLTYFSLKRFQFLTCLNLAPMCFVQGTINLKSGKRNEQRKPFQCWFIVCFLGAISFTMLWFGNWLWWCWFRSMHHLQLITEDPLVLLSGNECANATKCVEEEEKLIVFFWFSVYRMGIWKFFNLKGREGGKYQSETYWSEIRLGSIWNSNQGGWKLVEVVSWKSARTFFW